MLRITLCLSLLLITGTVSSLSPDTLAQVTKSVIAVKVQVPVDAALSQEKDLWAKLETFVGRKLLGNLIDLSSGTGFFVDTDGHILTNAHVVSPDQADERLRSLVDGWQRYLGDEVPGTVLTADEKFRLRVDFRRVFQKAKESISILVGDKMTPARIANLNDSFDLALLKADLDAPSVPLALAPATLSPSVGSEVTAIGYPLAFVLARLFEQNTATATQGTVSALRNELWSIQHTAALNPGNSGGPLVDDQGRVVGVNVGLIASSNGLYYALPTKTVEAFLSQSGKQTIWMANQALGAPGMTRGPRVETVGSKVFLDSEKDTRVYSGNQYWGTVPLVLSLTEEITVFRLQSPRGEATLSLKLDRTIEQVKSLSIRLNAFQASVDLQTHPVGADLFIDGLPVGKSPLKSELPVGKHTFTARLAGFEFPTQELLVERTGTVTPLLEGQPLTTFVFDQPPPTGTKVSLFRAADQTRRTLLDPDALLLPPGRWEMTIENPGVLKPSKILLDTSGPTKISTGDWYERARFSVLNVKPGSTLLIDGEAQPQPPVDGQVYEVSAGNHSIQITLAHHLPFEKNLRLVAGRSTTVTVLQEATSELYRSNRLWTGGLLLGGGLLVGIVDVAYLSTQSHLFTTPSPTGVTPLHYAAGYSFVGALLSAGFGVFFLLSDGK